jgi:hypothetical protein
MEAPVFILTEQTPNLEAMKFVPHVRLTDRAARAFTRKGFAPHPSPATAAISSSTAST